MKPTFLLFIDNLETIKTSSAVLQFEEVLNVYYRLFSGTQKETGLELSTWDYFDFLDLAFDQNLGWFLYLNTRIAFCQDIAFCPFCLLHESFPLCALDMGELLDLYSLSLETFAKESFVLPKICPQILAFSSHWPVLFEAILTTY